MDTPGSTEPDLDLRKIHIEQASLMTDAHDEDSPVATAYVKLLDREEWTALELLQAFESLPGVQKLCAQQDLEDALWVRKRIFDFLEKAIVFAAELTLPPEEIRSYEHVSRIERTTRGEIAKAMWLIRPPKIEGVSDTGDISLGVLGALRAQCRNEIVMHAEEPLLAGLRTIPDALVELSRKKWDTMNITTLIDGMEGLLRETHPEMSDALQEKFLRFVVRFAGKQQARKLDAYYHMQESTRALLITEITRRINCDLRGIR